MPKTIQYFTEQLHALHDFYAIPTEAKETRDEIRRIVRTFESHVEALRYEELDSAANLGSQ